VKVLFIGGTGLISTACARLAIERGIDLFLLTRGSRPGGFPDGATAIVADANRPGDAAAALAGHEFDAVVDWIVFTPEQLRRDVELFRGRTGQFVLVSSASAYRKPPRHYLVREETPLANPYWGYARNKILAEQELTDAVESGFPGVIVRPSLTYGDPQIPLAVNSWQHPYTALRRMREGRPVIVPGDGSSLWTLTHNSDFAKGIVGLLGNPTTIGEAFHITSDEVLTWDMIYRETARAAGVDDPHLVHVASDFVAASLPAEEGNLLGDKAVSAVFDNSKIKRFVPGFSATVGYAEGIARTLAWFDADAARRTVDEDLDRAWDTLLAAYSGGLDAARKAMTT
jgi:nucleoside-diphosphate-sugar epimerase